MTPASSTSGINKRRNARHCRPLGHHVVPNLLANRLSAALLVSAIVSTLAGCRICATCDIEDYGAYGGAWERTRRDDGRVASVFNPAGAKAPELVPRDAPETADVRQRQLQAESGEDAEDAFESFEERQQEEDGMESLEELRERRLDDIRQEREEELRRRRLDDIDMDVETDVEQGVPAPPDLS